MLSPNSNRGKRTRNMALKRDPTFNIRHSLSTLTACLGVHHCWWTAFWICKHVNYIFRTNKISVMHFHLITLLKYSVFEIIFGPYWFFSIFCPLNTLVIEFFTLQRELRLLTISQKWRWEMSFMVLWAD